MCRRKPAVGKLRPGKIRAANSRKIEEASIEATSEKSSPSSVTAGGKETASNVRPVSASLVSSSWQRG